MDKLTRLPPGFRFHPTDEELVVQYLKRKAMSCPLPAAIIPDINLGKNDPWDLPGCDQESERYFFSLQESKYRKGKRSNRATRSGYWKASGKDRMIHGSNRNELVGMKKVLVFHHGSVRTRWIMHEYRLAPNQGGMVEGTRWVVCRIFKKKEEKRDSDMAEDIRRYCNNSAASSCVTDLSYKECSDIGEEEASSKLIASSSAP